MPETWTPKRSLSEVHDLLYSPGTPHEMESCVIDGVVQRVYKNLWPSIRAFWLWAADQHPEKINIVFEDQRYTFRNMLDRSVKTASIYEQLYDIKKGDRVGICSRNYPDYMAAFWACHLLGAVSVHLNAWLPCDSLCYCLTQTQCKLVIVDAERATVLQPAVQKLKESNIGCSGFIVIESHEGNGRCWTDMKPWHEVFESYQSDWNNFLNKNCEIKPEDNAVIAFTSGTTGRPKGVLSTQRMFLTNIRNASAGAFRAAIRRGDNPFQVVPEVGPQKGILLSVPLFHVTGLTSYAMIATERGLKLVMMRKWNADAATRLIMKENVTIAGGVPSMVADLLEKSLNGHMLDTLMFGGSVAPDVLAKRGKEVFPMANMSQGYGLTETNSVAVGFAGEDYLARPTSCGLASPVNDILVISDDNVRLSPGQAGEIWLKGPNVMKYYWGEPEETKKVLSDDGWFKTGDIGYQDEEGFLYIKDRKKDMIIRGGENIDSSSVENALHGEKGVREAAAVGVPDPRLGELVAAVVSVKSGYHDKVTERSLIEMASKRLPRFAVPVMIIIQEHELDHTPSGKIVKTELRKMAQREWRRRTMKSSKL